MTEKLTFLAAIALSLTYGVSLTWAALWAAANTGL